VTLGRIGTEKCRFKLLRYVRGLHRRGKRVQQYAATRVTAAEFHASLCHSSNDKIALFHQHDPSVSRAATKDSLEPILGAELWVGERFRKTSGSLIVICSRRDGFFESGAKLGFG